jgi:uncharacterized membrane protein
VKRVYLLFRQSACESYEAYARFPLFPKQSGGRPIPQVAVLPVRARTRSQKKLVFFLGFFAVTAFVTYMKNAKIFHPDSDIARHFAPGMVFLIPHAIFASLALVMGAFQFSTRLRSRYLRVHRAMGYAYVTCVMVGAPMGVPLALKVGTPSLVAASAVQAFGWMLCTGIALYCIRKGNVQQHRRWMFRGYPFAMAFTVARMIIPIPPILRSGSAGIESVVWTTIALAAFLPGIILDWQAITQRPTMKPQAS